MTPEYSEINLPTYLASHKGFGIKAEPSPNSGITNLNSTFLGVAYIQWIAESKDVEKLDRLEGSSEDNYYGLMNLDGYMNYLLDKFPDNSILIMTLEEWLDIMKDEGLYDIVGDKEYVICKRNGILIPIN